MSDVKPTCKCFGCGKEMDAAPLTVDEKPWCSRECHDKYNPNGSGWKPIDDVDVSMSRSYRVAEDRLARFAADNGLNYRFEPRGESEFRVQLGKDGLWMTKVGDTPNKVQEAVTQLIAEWTAHLANAASAKADGHTGSSCCLPPAARPVELKPRKATRREQHVRIVEINTELFVEAMKKLPSDSEIVAINIAFDRNAVQLKVRSWAFGPVSYGDVIPNLEYK